MEETSLAELRHRFGLAQEALARIIGVSVRTVARWEAGQSAPSPMAARQIRALNDLDLILRGMFRPESIPDWMGRPLTRLGNRTPRDVLVTEGAESLLRFVREIAPPG